MMNGPLGSLGKHIRLATNVHLLTSSNEEKDLIRSYSFGAKSYVRKPVDFNQFNDAVRQLGLYWLFWNEPPPLPKNHRGGRIEPQ